jgi:phosphonate transport system substrate-binding protein
MREVQRGTAAACATSPLVLSMLPPELTKDLRAIGETHTVPGVVFLVHQRVPPPVRDQLGAEIMSWNDSPAGREILKSIGFGEFGPVNKAAYEQLPSLEGKN